MQDKGAQREVGLEPSARSVLGHCQNSLIDFCLFHGTTGPDVPALGPFASTVDLPTRLSSHLNPSEGCHIGKFYLLNKRLINKISTETLLEQQK